MLCQVFADRFDSGHQAARKIALLKPLGHGADDVMPELLAHLLVDAAVAQHDELAARRHDEEQHGIAMLRRGHAESLECLLGGRPNIAPE